jgi:U2-associated protein SR140
MNPVFIPDELIKTLQPPLKSGLPFNAQLDISDVEKGYIVPKPIPRPLPSELVCQLETNPDLANADRAYREFIEVFKRSTVRVCVPQDRSLLDRIHKTIEFVIREGPVFESIITAREGNNPDYNFLYDYESNEHAYYRWKLYSILHGDDPYAWRTEEFRMHEEGPIWRPPPLNPFADGMPIDLVEKLTGISKEALAGTSTNLHRLMNIKDGSSKLKNNSQPDKLNPVDSRTLNDILKKLEPTKSSVGSAMLFCIQHSCAAEEIIGRIENSISASDTSIKRQLALLYLISDILNNSSAAVTNASFYREGFKDKLCHIFLTLRDYIQKLDNVQQVKKLQQKFLNILGAWRYYQLYEDEFVLQLSNTLFRSNTDKQGDATISSTSFGPSDTVSDLNVEFTDEQLDGEPIDEATLAECLERKGLSLRWYKTLDLSDDEADTDMRSPQDRTSPNVNASPGDSSKDKAARTSPTVISKERFKVSKWELVTDEPERSPSIIGGSLMPGKLVSNEKDKIRDAESLG